MVQLLLQTEPRETRILARIDSATNPESAEMLDDGETLIYGNCTMVMGNPHHRGGKSLVYLQGQAFMSQARLTGEGEVTVTSQRLVEGLTGTLGSEVHRIGTRLWPAGTGLTACGGRPFAKDIESPLGSEDDARQQIYAFDPLTGESRGRIALWKDSPIAKALGHHVEMPNGIAVAPNGDIYLADNPNSDPVAAKPPPVPSCAYRIPYESIDALLEDDAAAAATVQTVEWEGWFNGIAASPLDGSAWAVTCSYDDPLNGAVIRIDADDFAAGRLPDPFVKDLGICDGVAVSRRGTVFATNPIEKEIFAFPVDGSRQRFVIDGARLPVANPADVNVIYPAFLGGEPALTVGDICVGWKPGTAQILVLDIAGL
jgi:outer membrane protein assembly factor BamB